MNCNYLQDLGDYNWDSRWTDIIMHWSELKHRVNIQLERVLKRNRSIFTGKNNENLTKSKI